MKYGIIEEVNKLFCKNCENLVSNTPNLTISYCPICGNPLSVDAIMSAEKLKLESEKNTLIKVRDTAKELKTDSVVKTLTNILEEYK